MYNNNNYNNYGNPMFQGGSQYGKPIVAKMTQALTQEEFNKLKSDSKGDFVFRVEPEEKLAAMCTHKDPQTGQTTLSNNGDGTCTCWICKKTFMLEDNQDTVEGCTNKMHDILQTIKTYHLDIPAEFAREYFQIIPLLERVPKLFKIASACFQKYENNGFGANPNGQMNSFNMYSALGGGMGMNYGQQPQGYGYPQQQQYGYPQQAQQQYGYPQQNQQQYGYPQQNQPAPYEQNGFIGGQQPNQQQNGFANPAYGQQPNQQQGNFAPQGGFAPGVNNQAQFGNSANGMETQLPNQGQQQVGTTISTTKTLDV